MSIEKLFVKPLLVYKNLFSNLHELHKFIRCFGDRILRKSEKMEAVSMVYDPTNMFIVMLHFFH